MKKIKIYLFLMTLAGMFFLHFNFALAQSAVIYVSPSTKSLNTGDVINISVGVAPKDARVDTVGGTLSISPLFSCQSISIASGLFQAGSNFSCDNLSFTLGITGGTTTSKVLFTITLKAEKNGSASVGVAGSKVIQEGEDISHSVSGGSYTISEPCNCGSWSSWKSGSCGGGGCKSNERLQTRTRTCNPSLCDKEKETQCVIDPTCEKKTTTPIQTVISPPSNIRAQDVPSDDGRAIKISWSASPTNDISGYFILRKSAGDAYYKIIKSVEKGILSFIDNSCAPGQSYDYTIIAYKGSWDNRSSWPQKATATAIDNLKKEGNKEDSQSSKLEILLDESGRTSSNLIREILGGKVIVSVFKGTEILDNKEGSLKEITIIKLIGDDIKSPDDLVNIGIAMKKDDVFLPGAIFDLKPDGTKFSPGIKIAFRYDSSLIPEGFQEDDLVIKFQTDSKWVSLSTKLDKEKKLVSAEVKHFTLFGIFLEKKSIEKKAEAKVTPVIYPVSYQDKVDWAGITGGILAFLAILSFTLYYFKSPNIIEGLKKEYPHIFEELKDKKSILRRNRK